ncbi:hypothetical protein JOD24_000273 [Kroppenstedtia sanguinis]
MKFVKVIFFSLSTAFLLSILSLNPVTTSSDLSVPKYNVDQPGG